MGYKERAVYDCSDRDCDKRNSGNDQLFAVVSAAVFSEKKVGREVAKADAKQDKVLVERWERPDCCKRPGPAYAVDCLVTGRPLYATLHPAAYCRRGLAELCCSGTKDCAKTANPYDGVIVKRKVVDGCKLTYDRACAYRYRH